MVIKQLNIIRKGSTSITYVRITPRNQFKNITKIWTYEMNLIVLTIIISVGKI